MKKVIKILLIEDDELDQVQVRRVLVQKGILHKLKVVASGEEGLQFLGNEANTEFEGSPDIILLDVNLPKISGFEFLTRFQKMKNYHATKVFVLASTDAERKKCIEMGVSGYIKKPFALNRLSKDTISLLVDLMNLE
jgi:CheY-like chemotaxis protein